jgi:Flp pilus assembly protein TadD
MKLGEFCFNHGLMDETKYFFEKVLLLEPNNSDALNNIGVLYFTLGDKESARSLFNRALELNPLHFEAVENFKILNN